MKDAAALLFGIGLLATGLGLLWPWLERLGLDKIGLGRLPGDLHFDSGDMHFHLPLGTSVLVAVLIAIPLLIWKHGGN
jgi:hypothetical protein